MARRSRRTALLAAKLVTVVFLIMGLWRLTDPFEPFIGFLDDLGSPSRYQHVLQVVWLGAVACLLLNRFVRVSCGVLGATILLAVLSSQVFRANNLVFTALLLLLIGLSERSTLALLIRGQLFVLYFWAGMNKLLDEGWRSGAFFESWNSIQSYGGVYHSIASVLPGKTLSAIMCWAVIVTELFFAVTFAVRRLVVVGTLLVVAYHSSLLFLVGATFTMFWFAVLAACLALTPWPAERPVVRYGEDGPMGALAGVLRRLDLGGALAWTAQKGSGLAFVAGDRSFAGRDALARTLLYHPTLYFAFFALVALPQPQRRWGALVAFAVVGYAAFDLGRNRLRPVAVEP